MEGLLHAISTALAQLDWRSLVDILIVAVIVYWLLTLIQGTTAVMLVRGIVGLLLVGTVLGNLFNLTVLSWVLRNSLPALIVAVPILFQPELRRALEQVGRAGGFLPHAPVLTNSGRVVDVVALAARRLAERRWGALLVLERETALGEYAQTGVEIDGSLSVELLLNIFYPNSPLHDGAVIVRGDRLVAAGCVLPLAAVRANSMHYGTRHRAALGITEQTDAITVVVSEETGRISLANNGRLVANLDEGKLRKVLGILYRPPMGEQLPAWIRGRTAAKV
ncbi:MAG TPA: diadenylate cyclase CdaA [Chloroflexota bacterium]|nr:diadenylate cyclase CdaA [Chloroflexota bacterium]